jgi:hypothetical protein
MSNVIVVILLCWAIGQIATEAESRKGPPEPTKRCPYCAETVLMAA